MMKYSERSDAIRDFFGALIHVKNAKRASEIADDERLFGTLVMELKDRNDFAKKWTVYMGSIGWSCPDFQEAISDHIAASFFQRTFPSGRLYVRPSKRLYPQFSDDALEFAKLYLEKLGIKPDENDEEDWCFVDEGLPKNDGVYLTARAGGGIGLSEFRRHKREPWWAHNVVAWKALPPLPEGLSSHKDFVTLQAEAGSKGQ